jgi:hypothetical protein
VKRSHQKRNLALMMLVATIGLVSVAFTKLSQTVYFTQSVTTLSTWMVTGALTTETWGRVCGNTPWNMTVITAACQNEPVPEFPSFLVALLPLILIAVLLRRKYSR